MYWGVDYSTDWTSFDQTHSTDSTFDATDDRIEGNGVTTFTFVTEANPVGTVFRAIRFRVDLLTGTSTESPDVISMELKFLKVRDAKFTFEFDLDLSISFNNRSPRQQRTALEAAATSTVLVPFTHRDDANTFYVDVELPFGTEYSGHDERGQIRVLVKEPN